MKELREARLRKDRIHLRRALNDIESGEIWGVRPGDRDTIRDLLIVKIANIDWLLENSAEKE
jgi:hypothetical protein